MRKRLENFLKNADICINLVGILYEKRKGNTFKNIHTVFPSLAQSCVKNII